VDNESDYLTVRHHEADALDPIAIYVAVVIFVVGPLLAAAYIWLDRRMSKRTGTDQIRLTPIGSSLLITFAVVLGVAVVFRQFYPESEVGAWLRTEGVMTNVVVGCIAALFVIEAFLRWLGKPTAANGSERDV
jgi:hypothetical protein